jgi:proline dehydrogenase
MPVKLPVKEELPTSAMIPSAGATDKAFLDQIPLRVVMLLAAPYLAGKNPADAIRLAHKLYRESRFTGTLDILGEDADSVEDCEAAVTAYMSLIDDVGDNLLPVDSAQRQLTVSMKPSMFSITAPGARGGNDPNLDEAFERIRKVVEYGFRKGVKLTLEAEDHRWTDFHLETYFALINEGFTNLGTVLQSRLFRTRNDVRRFDERMRVRLVIGIYNEPAERAHTNKQVMKETLVEHAGELLQRGTYVEVASHDHTCIEHFFRDAAYPNRAPADRFETQFLLGVPRKKLQNGLVSGSYFEHFRQADSARSYFEELAATGVLVRLYLPFGKESVAGPYCKRRLKANPNMIGYGIKNFLHIE